MKNHADKEDQEDGVEDYDKEQEDSDNQDPENRDSEHKSSDPDSESEKESSGHDGEKIEDTEFVRQVMNYV